MNKIEETNNEEYPFKLIWGNGLSWSLCKSREEAESKISKAITNGDTWLTTSQFNRY